MDKPTDLQNQSAAKPAVSTLSVITPETEQANLENAAREAIAGKLLSLFPNGCERILIFNPFPFETANFQLSQAMKRRYYAWPPYGPAALVSALRSRDYTVHLVDLNYELLKFAIDGNHEDNGEINDKLQELMERRIREEIETFNPDLVALSCMFTMTHRMMCDMASFIKKVRPGQAIFAGGVHVSNSPEFVLNESKDIDVLGIYECDVSLGDALDFINGKEGEEKLSQLAILHDGKTTALQNRAAPNPLSLNIIPDYDGLPIGDYSRLGEIGTYRAWLPKEFKASSVLTNRGCRAHCSFCSVRNFNGKGVRARSVESVIDEIEHLNKEHGVTHIAWLDDDLFFDKQRAIKLFDGIVERGLKITWCASNGVIASAAAATPDLIRASAASGCRGMTFGIESGNDEILKAVHKPSGVKHFHMVGDLMKQYPEIFTRGFLIIGFPNETLSQIQDTINLGQKMGLDWYGIQLLSPLPNTEIYQTMVQLGLITDHEIKKNKENTGNKVYTVRNSENQRKREQDERNAAREFINLFEHKPLTHIPNREELHDLWLVVDYLINYYPIAAMHEPVKLQKKQAILTDICDRFTREHPLANMFLSMVESRLGNVETAKERWNLGVKYLADSAYWRKRFEVLKIYQYFEGLEAQVTASIQTDGNSRADSDSVSDIRKVGGYVV